MSVVKPPTFEELVKAYGSPKAAVMHLIESGFTPEKIEWKIGVPYYLTRLYMEEFEPGDRLLFEEIVKVYERLAVLRGKRGKETALVNFLQGFELDLETKIRLALGWLTDESLKIGPGIVKRSISLATGASINKVRRLLVDYGEHGEVVYLLTRNKPSTLTVREVCEAIRFLPKLSGMKERELYVSSLLRKATPSEAKYLVRLLLGDLKLGYHQRTVMRAIARIYKVPVELVENVCAITGTIEGLVLASRGEVKLSAVKLRPGRFLKPQLAHLYEPDKVVYPVRAEYKLDGSRLQIHKWGTKVWLFSRRGVEKSRTLPEVVEIARKFKAHSYIVDSEVVAVDASGNFLPFQVLLERTVPQKPSLEELEERMRKVRVTIRAFDVLYVDGRGLMSLPLAERRKHLAEIVPSEYIVEGTECKNEIELLAFYEEALNKGLEGIIVKNLESTYEVGRRTYTWLKLKPERDTIDCIIVKSLHGKGKRAGLYSSFLLAVRDPKERRLYTIGKVSNLPEQTMETLRTIIERTRISEDREGVFVKPSIVVEATYQEIQRTDEYSSGYALRVPKIVRFREEKKIEEIDDVQKVAKLYELQYERHPAKELP